MLIRYVYQCSPLGASGQVKVTRHLIKLPEDLRMICLDFLLISNVMFYAPVRVIDCFLRSSSPEVGADSPSRFQNYVNPYFFCTSKGRRAHSSQNSNWDVASRGLRHEGDTYKPGSQPF
jgi:hypothetical protein